jgi:hypothetical protein
MGAGRSLRPLRCVCGDHFNLCALGHLTFAKKAALQATTIRIWWFKQGQG